MGSSMASNSAVMRLASASIRWPCASTGALISARVFSSAPRKPRTSARAALAAARPWPVVTSNGAAYFARNSASAAAVVRYSAMSVGSVAV